MYVWPKDSLSFAVRICYRSWNQSYINSCFSWCDYRLFMVCHFCDVTFVYGESLQWGFGFNLLLLYRMCNRIQGRTPVFGYVICLVHDLFEVDLLWTLGLVLTCWVNLEWRSIRLWFLKWTFCDPMVCSFGFVWFWGSIRLWFLMGIPWMFMVDVVWYPSEIEFWGGSRWCCRQNLLLLIRFQHEGVCEAWTPGSWLPWWTI